MECVVKSVDLTAHFFIGYGYFNRSHFVGLLQRSHKDIMEFNGHSTAY
jgi:hypothetical protein